MCDYSLHSVGSRPAKVGDKLITTKFHGTLTRGFAAVEEKTIAVCLLPGTEVAFEKDARYDGFWRSKSIGATTAVFRQVNESVFDTSHDALEFANGMIRLVTELSPGQHATVLQLPVQMTEDHRKAVTADISYVEANDTQA